LALLSGLCIAAAMPPWGWWPLALVGIAMWDRLCAAPRKRTRAVHGALVGLGWFLPSTLWMLKISVAGWPFGAAGWFGGLCALTGVLCPPDRRRHLILPALLIGSEWLRWQAPFGGVPLSMLAMTQAHGPLLFTARIGGSLLVSGAVALLGAALAAAGARQRTAALALGGIVVVLAVGGHVAPHGHDVGEIRVAAIQGGGPQGTWASTGEAPVVFQRHLDASRRIQDPVDLIVWPENTVSVYRFEGSLEQAKLRELAQQHQATLEAGVVEDDQTDKTKFLNRSVLFGPDGNQIGLYDKVRRVPFGEYLPLRSLLSGFVPPGRLGRDARVGTGTNALDTPPGRVGIVISWEVFFPRRSRAALHDGAELLLNPTNGSSYWLTQVQTQQVASSILRATESGRWMVQAAPTGFSAFVDPDGNVHQRTTVSEAAAIQRTIQLRQGDTWATRTGDLVPLLLALALIAVALGSSARRSAKTFDGHSQRT
jgi:apolipoprotein N-acyltransferase